MDKQLTSHVLVMQLKLEWINSLPLMFWWCSWRRRWFL